MPYVDLNPPWVYMCSPSWTRLPPPSPSHPSGLSQFTSPEHPVSCIKPGVKKKRKEKKRLALLSLIFILTCFFNTLEIALQDPNNINYYKLALSVYRLSLSRINFEHLYSRLCWNQIHFVLESSKMWWWMRKEPRGESVSDFGKAVIDNILCSKQKVVPSNVVDWGCLLRQSCWEEHQDSKFSVSFTALQMTFSHDAKFQFLLTSILVPRNFPGGSAGKESACNAGDLGLIPGLGRSPGEEKGYLLQYSGLENSIDCV